MYLAIDIETTGLDPEEHQILEIAAVLNVPRLAVCQCPLFVMPVAPNGNIVGTAYALCMNQRLLKSIANKEPFSLHTVLNEFKQWLNGLQLMYEFDRLTPLGKNVGSFDWQFLIKQANFPRQYFGYRFLDIGSLYSTEDGISGQSDLVTPSFLARHGITGEPHEALFDAQVSLALARDKWRKS